MKILLTILAAVFAAAVAAGIICLIRTLLKPVRHSDYSPQSGKGGSEDARALEYARKLSRMVRYDTTSYPFSEEHPADVQRTFSPGPPSSAEDRDRRKSSVFLERKGF